MEPGRRAGLNRRKSKTHRKLGASEASKTGQEENSGEQQEDLFDEAHEDQEEGSSHDEEEGQEAEPVEGQDQPQAPQYDPVMMHHAMMAGPMMANAQMMMMAANPYLNPMHPMHPFQHEFNVQHNYVTPAGVMNLDEGGEQHDDSFNLPHLQVKSHCGNVKKQALEIANTMLKKQNHIVMKRLMNYLLKSKYLIGMTEIKLTRKLRRNIFNIMGSFASVTDDNVHFVNGAASSLDDMSGDSSSSSNASIASLDSSTMSDPDVVPDTSSEQLDHIGHEIS